MNLRRHLNFFIHGVVAWVVFWLRCAAAPQKSLR